MVHTYINTLQFIKGEITFISPLLRVKDKVLSPWFNTLKSKHCFQGLSCIALKATAFFKNNVKKKWRKAIFFRQIFSFLIRH